MKLSQGLEKPFPVHLHVHSSISGAPASMAAQNFVARKIGGSHVIWWTDADWRMSGHGCVSRADFESDTLTERERVFAPSGVEFEPPAQFTELSKKWVKEAGAGKFSVEQVSTSTEQVLSGARSLKFRVTTSETEFQPLFYRLTSDGDAHRRPLAGDIQLRFAVRPVGPVSDNVKLILRVTLSEQPSGDVCELRYIITRSGSAVAPSAAGACVEIPLAFKEDTWGAYELDITRDARDFRLGGEDNGLTGIALGVEVRNATATVFFDRIEIVQRLKGQQVLEKQRAMSRRYLSEDCAHYVGYEVSYGPHIAAYGPGLLPPNYEKARNGLTAKEAVSFIQSQGGIASICHPLSAKPGSLAVLEFRGERPADPLARMERVAQRLVAGNAFGAKVLEVAYEPETLPASLRLWDRLSAAGIALTGIGVNDSHSMREGWRDGFLSWLYAPTHNEGDLLESLKAGRVFFGRADLFGGRLDLSTPAGHRMGNMALVNEDSQTVNLIVEGAPPGLTGVTVIEGKDVETFPVGAGSFQHGIPVDTRVNTFVRVEIYNREGLPAAFSNPIYFVRTAPKQGLPPDRAVKLTLRLK